MASLEYEQEQGEGTTQEDVIELNIGGRKFVTTTQVMVRLSDNFFSGYLSGMFSLDACDDGSIFVDRDGEHFGHVLGYLQDGILAMGAPDARPSAQLLRLLKREFDFYCIQPVSSWLLPIAIGGNSGGMHGEEACTERLVSGRWIMTAPMDSARYQFGACVLDGEILVSGGRGPESLPLASVETYSLVTNSWTTLAMLTLPYPRYRHMMATVGPAVFVMGGAEMWSMHRTGPTASVLKFDNTQDISWCSVAPMPFMPMFCAICAIDQAIYVFGGHFAGRAQATVAKYDTIGDTWSVLAPMPLIASFSSACVMDGIVYMVGAGDCGKRVLRFDPVSIVWSILTSTSRKRESSSCFALGGYVYATGGWKDASVERYDVASDTWSFMANMNVRREDLCVVTIKVDEEMDLFDLLIANKINE
jgi:hypothetical protein